MAGVIEPSALRAAVFDLDETLLDRRQAWRFAVEEAIAAATGQRVSAEPLLREYRLRPFRDAIRILVSEPSSWDACERLATAMYRRSAMKKLLVHDGIGMALDELREAGLEIGAVSMEAHADAVKQVQSTGLDRFLAVLSAAGAPWDPVSRWQDCLRFLGQPPRLSVFVSGNERDIAQLRSTGAATIHVTWQSDEPPPRAAIAHPQQLVAAIRAARTKSD